MQTLSTPSKTDKSYTISITAFFTHATHVVFHASSREQARIKSLDWIEANGFGENCQKTMNADTLEIDDYPAQHIREYKEQLELQQKLQLDCPFVGFTIFKKVKGGDVFLGFFSPVQAALLDKGTMLYPVTAPERTCYTDNGNYVGNLLNICQRTQIVL